MLQDEASQRPCVSFLRAEEILNWQRSVLTRVVLKDGERVRELRVVGAECLQEVWAEVDGAWSVEERCVLKRGDVALSLIPFVGLVA